MRHWKIKTHIIAEEVFQYALVTYLILFLIETLEEGFVSFFFNFHYLLIVILLSGIIMTMTHRKELEQLRVSQKRTWKDNVLIGIIASGGALLVFSETVSLGVVVALIAAGLTAIIIIVLSALLVNDYKKK